MKLTLKSTVALLAAFCALLIAYGSCELERQTSLAEEQLRTSQQTLGRMFRPNVARTWRLEGEIPALYLIEYTEQTLKEKQVESAFELRWVWLDATADEPYAPTARSADLGALARGDEVTLLVRGSGADERMVTYVPVAIGMEDERRGALEISGSLAPVRSFGRSARRRLLATVALGAGALAVLSLAVGAWFVGRPIRRLVEAARRIGRGELSTRVDMAGRRDELGTLARAFNATAEDLETAWTKASEESEARILALEQMRHADRLATVGQLASGMAHELGTPLAVVAGRAQLIVNGTARGDTVVEYAQSIERQADRMAAIIRQLLDFARRRSATLSPKDVNGLVRQTLDLLRNMASKHGVTLTADLRDEPHNAPVDGNQVQQVLTNLVVNAVQATPRDGEVIVRVFSEVCQPPPEVGRGPAPHLCIEVADSGPGMKPEVASRVFEPFFTTKPVGEGTGLGLSVSHGIVSDHGGWISVTSAEGQGSCFSVYLPFSTEVECPDES